MKVRVRIDRDLVERMVERVALPGAESAARFMADEQRTGTRSSRLAGAVTHESGRDARGVYARAGMGRQASRSGRAFFWYFEEYGTGRGGGRPFIRPSLLNNLTVLGRMLTRGR